MKTFRLLLGWLFFLVISAIIFWRFPINGLGSVAWIVGIFVMGFIRHPHIQRNKNNKITESRQSGLENALLATVFLGSWLLPVIHLTTGWFSVLNYDLPDWALAFGVVILGLGLWLFGRSHVDLGRNWSVTLHLRVDHKLSTEGVYKRLRHPMYSALYIIYIAQALLLHNWIAGLGGLVSFTLLFIFRVPREEAMMRERFGKEYEEFCRSRGQVIPKF